MRVKPIETRYAGCRFRSRLEARWAVFFDHLGIRWEYELQGWGLPHGAYLPDFCLRELRRGHDLWFEVKPDLAAPGPDDERWSDLVVATKQDLVVARGMPRPDGDMIDGSVSGDGWMQIYSYVDDSRWDGTEYAGWDNFHAFCVCPVCGKIGIEFEGRGERICAHGGSADTRTGNDPRIRAAYTAARSARFEHGERGA